MIQIKEEAQATNSTTLLLFLIRYLHTKCYNIIKKEVSLHFRAIRLTYPAYVIEGLTTKKKKTKTKQNKTKTPTYLDNNS